MISEQTQRRIKRLIITLTYLLDDIPGLEEDKLRALVVVLIRRGKDNLDWRAIKLREELDVAISAIYGEPYEKDRS